MKNLRISLRNIFFISVLFSELVKPQFLFTPFEDASSFNGSWDLKQEIPNYIAAYIREFHKVNVLSSTAYLSLAEDKGIDNHSLHDLKSYNLIANEIGFKYVIIGKIFDFSISRFNIGETNIAGYEAYSCNIEIYLQIFDLISNSVVYSGTIESSENNKGLGLNLFGLPSDEKKQYLALNIIKFGGEEFNETLVGETMLVLCQDLVSDIKSNNRTLLTPEKKNRIDNLMQDKALDDIKLNVEMIKGQILTYDVETGEAFISLGASNNIKVGDVLSIYAPADSLFDPNTNEFLGLSDKNISALEIVELRGEKLSLAVVYNNRNLITKGLEVRKLVLRKNKER